MVANWGLDIPGQGSLPGELLSLRPSTDCGAWRTGTTSKRLRLDASPRLETRHSSQEPMSQNRKHRAR
jgi:hypothetical protein